MDYIGWVATISFVCGIALSIFIGGAIANRIKGE